MLGASLGMKTITQMHFRTVSVESGRFLRTAGTALAPQAGVRSPAPDTELKFSFTSKSKSVAIIGCAICDTVLACNLSSDENFG